MTLFDPLFQKDLLPGFAEPAATKEYFERIKNSHPDYRQYWITLPGSGINVSRLGFGGYRTIRSSRNHFDAIRESILSGTNVIDTSSNYGDGESEALIGDVLRELISAGRIRREELVIITKAGYIQGKNLTMQKENPAPDTIHYDRNIWHCIHPEFLSEQIELSQKRLGLQTLDVFLLHNPEYYLLHGRKKGIPLSDARAEYYSRIMKALEFLEEKRKEGIIKQYGISSNTLPKNPEAYDATDLEQILSFAPQGFSVIQFPANMLETEFRHPDEKRATLAEVAKQAGLWTLANRPLNAFSPAHGLFRLAGSIEGGERPDLSKMLSRLEAAEQRISDALIEKKFQFDRRHPAFSDFLKAHADSFRDHEHLHMALPHILPEFDRTVRHLQTICSDNEQAYYALENYVRLCNGCISWWEKYIRAAHDSQTSEIQNYLAEKVDTFQKHPLAVQAILYLLSEDIPHTVLTGMRKIDYVRQFQSVYKDSEPESINREIVDSLPLPEK